MQTDNRDSSIVRHILNYCNEIDQTVLRFGNNPQQFREDKIYRNAATMCILQIGELAGRLSEAFLTTHTEIPWRSIKAMRNIAAHAYGSMEAEDIWETIVNDIPTLKTYCEKLL